jgi:Sulfotransferase family
MSKQNQPAAAAVAAGAGGMEMPRWLDALGGFIDRTAGFWQKLGDLESSANRAELDAIPIDRPIYVAGLARSGSTILLELLAARPGVATHRYRDFPPIFTPLVWNRAFAQVYRADAPPAERAHKDRILVTPDSPEAMEEVLWMRFFQGIHDTGRSQVLDAVTINPAFERFYADHLKKILLIRQGRRYLSKGNYNLTRFAYLKKLFPGARFVVPVREPRWHVASLMKQHRLFCAEEERDPRILKHMQRVGHLEFGLDRRAINTGDAAAAQGIERLWRDGEEVRGWARYWAMLYGFALDQKERDPAGLGEAVHLVRYEDLCDRPEETLTKAFAHAELPLGPGELAPMAARLSQPTYYDPGFTPAEEAVIAEETKAVRELLDYA